MRWERLFDDLEARLEAEEQVNAAGEVTDLARAERARLSVVDRLRAHSGAIVSWDLRGDRPPISGPVVEVGADWVLVAAGGGEVLLPLAAVRSIGGLTRAAAPDSSQVARRLGIGTVLRGLSRDRSVVRLDLHGDVSLTGTIDRVGADHLDVALHAQDEPRRHRAVVEVRCVLLHALESVAVR